MLIRMTVEVEVPDVFDGEPCLEPAALLDGEALLLMHSNELGTTLGKVRVLSVGDMQGPNARLTAPDTAHRSNDEQH